MKGKSFTPKSRQPDSQMDGGIDKQTDRQIKRQACRLNRRAEEITRAKGVPQGIGNQGAKLPVKIQK